MYVATKVSFHVDVNFESIDTNLVSTKPKNISPNNDLCL